MKKLFYLIIFCGLSALYACQQASKPIQNIEKITLQPFTDTIKLDTFKISLKGKNSAEMKLIFTITSYQGSKIYEQVINGKDLLKGFLASADLEKEDEKIKFLTQEVAGFFEEEHFLVPAVMPNENADKNTPDLVFYEELKSTQLNGFDYRLSKDVKIYIAWSAKEKKVKIYYKCC
jgi:hypothetical protein